MTELQEAELGLWEDAVIDAVRDLKAARGTLDDVFAALDQYEEYRALIAGGSRA